ncbi:GNAT family N-acetyltransferase [Flavobacteriaceae bacterium]|nr:GNAT family N-acetyltransferase [Flavobacteriaceae bacterium]
MIEFREVNINDINIFFNWINDPLVRSLSFNSEKVSLKVHEKWFLNKINDSNCIMLLFFKANDPIGQVRIEKETLNQAVISISISNENRSKGYSVYMLKKASKYFHSKNPKFIINAYIKNNNLKSINSFEKASFKFQNEINYKGHESLNYILENDN